MIFNHIPLKAGIGLRLCHFQELLDTLPKVPWIEVHAENLKMGAAFELMQCIHSHYPISLHGVGLSLGSTLNLDHLKFLRQLIDQLSPGLVSEHLSWSTVDGIYFNDLLPLPYTQGSLNHLADNICKAQDFLGLPLLIENPTIYMDFCESTFTEWDFLLTLAEKADCQILLDINNIFVNCQNHGWSINDYLQNITQSDRIKEIHLAGYDILTLPNKKEILVDSHASFIRPNVWKLYDQVLNILGSVPTLIEWDLRIPSLDVLLDECEKAQSKIERIHGFEQVSN